MASNSGANSAVANSNRAIAKCESALSGDRSPNARTTPQTEAAAVASAMTPSEPEAQIRQRTLVSSSAEGESEQLNANRG